MLFVLMLAGFLTALSTVVCAVILDFPLILVLIAYPVAGMAGVLAMAAVALTVPARPRFMVRLLRQG